MSKQLSHFNDGYYFFYKNVNKMIAENSSHNYNFIQTEVYFKDYLMTDTLTHAELLSFTAQVVGAYVSNHTVELEELPAVIAKVYQTLSDANRNPNSLKNRTPLVPAVPIAESVTDDYIVCLEDGKKLQMLKRHLNTVYKMSLEQYKERWSLPADYPVVSPNYARRRSQIAKNTGLGVNGRRRRNLKVVVGQNSAEGQTQMAIVAAAGKN
jgi:predicted transcriptional regulator